MAFDRNWKAELLQAPPLIAPARSYVWPMRIEGEDDALARGAVNVMVRPAAGGAYLVTAALGFRDPTMPTGIWASPAADEICVVAGGYAYLADTRQPEQVTLLPIKPVVAVVEAPAEQLLLFIGFTTILAWGKQGKAWETARLSWEGLRITEATAGSLKGLGWDLMKDVEVEFSVDLRTGESSGGGYRVGER
jgi:hypothetical protein